MSPGAITFDHDATQRTWTDIAYELGYYDQMHMRDQLHGELIGGGGYVVPAKSNLVFSDPKDLWSTLVKGGDLQEAEAAPALGPSVEIACEQIVAAGGFIESKLHALNLSYWRFDVTNWQRRISPN